MTGFARTDGMVGDIGWFWEMRSVNGRGLELRLRLPPGWDALEPALRDMLAGRLRRGNVSASLTIKRDEQARITPDLRALEHMLALAQEVAARIPGCPPPRAEALLGLPGVLRQAAPEAPPDVAARQAQQAAFADGFAGALDQLLAMRAAEGERLAAVLRGLLDQVAALCAVAEIAAAGQPALLRDRMLRVVQDLLGQHPALPEERIAQEVALLARGCDVREELDRLASHVVAAHALLAEAALIGRRFDFLVQEFHREVNTLCSKSADIALTGIGLQLKAVVEQLREQVQNIE